MFLNSPSYDTENRAFYDALSNYSNTFILHITLPENTSHAMEIIQRSTLPSIIVFRDFEEARDPGGDGGMHTSKSGVFVSESAGQRSCQLTCHMSIDVN